jgi:hypothetical protein
MLGDAVTAETDVPFSYDDKEWLQQQDEDQTERH